jgi:agmatinase
LMDADTPRFLESELAPAPAHACRFHVIPVPYEATTSYGRGTAQGPQAVLAASNQLETWNGHGIPAAAGIYTRPAVDVQGGPEDVLERIEKAVLCTLDSGSEALPPGDREEQHADCARNNGPIDTESGRRDTVSVPFNAESSPTLPVVPVLLGGEHTVTLGALRALKNRCGDFGIIQFDAHADLRDSYDGTPYSHACVMRRAVDDLNLPLFQIGVRSLSREEHVFRLTRRIRGLNVGEAEDEARRHSGSSFLPSDFPGKIYVTFDVDVLDASLMPATGTPEPGGLLWRQVLALVERALAGRVCLGFDVVELAPLPGMHAPDYTAARLVYEIMGLTLPHAGPWPGAKYLLPASGRMPLDNARNFAFYSAHDGQVRRIGVTVKELINKLKDAGWTFREGVNHTVGISPDGARKTVVNRRSEDVGPETLRSLERQTGVKLS